MDLEPCKFKTMYMASLDVKTAFDVAKRSVVLKIFSDWYPRSRGGCLSGRDAGREGSACFENCETEFRDSKCIGQGGVEAPVLRGRVAQYVVWKAEERWKARRW